MIAIPAPFSAALAPLLDTAARSGLLAALERGPVTIDALTTDLGVDRRAVGLVLDALYVLGQCQRTPDGAWFRAPAPREDQLWTGLGTFLVDGRPLSPTDLPAARGALYAPIVATLGARFTVAARSLARQLPSAPRILDVGAGSGVWSLAMLDAWPDTRLVAVDLPEVLPAFHARAAALGHADRVTTISGPWDQVDPAPADLVVLANVLHLEAPDAAAALVSRAAGWVAPGGALVVVDCLIEGTPLHDLSRALYALHLGMRTARGGVYSAATIAAWCAAAGFPRATRIELEGEMAALGGLVARA